MACLERLKEEHEEEEEEEEHEYRKPRKRKSMKDYDAGDGTTMRRWYATMIANGIMVDWMEFV